MVAGKRLRFAPLLCMIAVRKVKVLLHTESGTRVKLPCGTPKKPGSRSLAGAHGTKNARTEANEEMIKNGF